MKHLFADGAYDRRRLMDKAAYKDFIIEVVKRLDGQKGFEVLPRRWVVERTLAWLNRNRRLAKDFEKTIASATAWLFLASVQLLARRVARIAKSNA